MRYQLQFLALAVVGIAMGASPIAQAGENWQGRRPISYQRSNDLFYNEYVGPGPCGVPAEMYVAPQPVPANVGHTWVTYQPLMPHELMYEHGRAYYNHQPGAGWTRTSVYYSGVGGWLQHQKWSLHHRSPRQPYSPW